MKVMCEAPTLPLIRLIATEHGIPCQARALRGRSRRSSRRSHDLPGSRGKLCTGRRATGEPLEPDTATRNADRPKGEERQLASRMLGKLARPVLRRADGKGPRERHLVSRLSYLRLSVLTSGKKQSSRNPFHHLPGVWMTRTWE